MNIRYIILVGFSTVFSFVDVQGHNEFENNDARYEGQNNGGYDRTEGGYGGSEFNDGSRNGGYGNTGHHGRMKIKGMEVPERVVEGAERKIHSMLEEGAEAAMSKVGFGDEGKRERLADKVADQAIRLADSQFRENPKSTYSNQGEGYGSGFSSQSRPVDDNYSHGDRVKSYDELGTSGSGYGNSNGGTGYGENGERSPRRDQSYGGARDESLGDYNYGGRGEEYGGRREEYGGRRDEYGDRREEYGGRRDESGYGVQRSQYGGGKGEYGDTY